MTTNTDPVRAQPTSELIDSVAFAISGTLPTTTKARGIAERVIEIVRDSLASAPPSAVPVAWATEDKEYFSTKSAADRHVAVWGLQQSPTPLYLAPPSAPDDVDRLVRELDVALNGPEGAAAQASLCDLVGQVQRVVRERGAPLLAPSAPVEVEEVWLFKGSDGAWHTFHSEKHLLDTIADGGWDVRKFTALPQQPAAPSAPVGVEWLRAELNASAAYAGDYIGDERVVLLAVAMRKIDKLAALAQQPAAPEGCGACGDGCANRSGGCRLAEENPPAAPSGEAVGAWVTVPRIPTDAMLDAMHGRIRILCNPAKRTADIQNDVEVWGAMLEAAPQQPAGVDGMVMVQASDLKTLAEFADRGMRGNPAKLAALRAKAILAAQQQGGA